MHSSAGLDRAAAWAGSGCHLLHALMVGAVVAKPDQSLSLGSVVAALIREDCGKIGRSFEAPIRCRRALDYRLAMPLTDGLDLASASTSPARNRRSLDWKSERSR